MRTNYLEPWTDAIPLSVKEKHYDKDYGTYKDGSMNVEYKAVVDYIVPLKPKSVLEVGCGLGNNIRTLSKHLKDTKFYGIDASEVAIDYCKRNSKVGDFRLCDARHLPFEDNSMDVVFTTYALEQMKYIIKDVSKEIHRVCKDTVVLFEPFFVMQNIFGKWHNIRSEYVQGIEFYFEDAGFELKEFRLLTGEQAMHKRFSHKIGVLVGTKNHSIEG